MECEHQKKSQSLVKLRIGEMPWRCTDCNKYFYLNKEKREYILIKNYPKYMKELKILQGH